MDALHEKQALLDEFTPDQKFSRSVREIGMQTSRHVFALDIARVND
jgi:hypothetical protein